MAAKSKCIDCPNIKSWSFEQNCVAFCPVVNKYVKNTDGCDKAGAKKAKKK